MAQQRIDSQIDIEKKREKATYLIDNQGDLNALQELCAKVKDRIIQDYREN
jgi:dephospho-CoA kinase